MSRSQSSRRWGRVVERFTENGGGRGLTRKASLRAVESVRGTDLCSCTKPARGANRSSPSGFVQRILLLLSSTSANATGTFRAIRALRQYPRLFAGPPRAYEPPPATTDLDL